MIVLSLVYALSVLAALGVLGMVCISDFRTMTIPNILPLALMGAFVAAYGANWGMAHAGGRFVFQPLPAHLITAVVMLGLTFLMFVIKAWGAGDSKLVTAISLWLGGVKGMIVFLMVMSTAGVVLVLFGLVMKRTKGWSGWDRIGGGPLSWPGHLKAGDRVLPYGIAIAFAAIVAFAVLGYVDLGQVFGKPDNG